MEEKGWKKFTLQSIVFLIAVLAFSFLRQGNIFTKNNVTEVMADDVLPEKNTIAVKATKVKAKEKQEKEAATGIKAEFEKPAISDMEHIKKRSSTYIVIPKAVVPTGAAVYLYDRYMDQEVCLVIDGMVKKGFSTDNIIRYNKGNKYSGKEDKDATDIKADKGKALKKAGKKTGKKAVQKNVKKAAKKTRGDALEGSDIVEGFQIKAYKKKNGKYRIGVNIKTKRLYAPALYETDTSYCISFAVPGKVYDKIVVVDAGHGGIDDGTRSARGHKEKEYNLLVLYELKDLLDKTDIKVYYTRLDDRKVSKAARTELANKLKADLLVSIHCNSSEHGDGRAYGVEALYSLREPANSDLSNKKLAKILLNNVAESVHNKKRGVIRREGLYIMHHSDVPASIIEIGYMSNKLDLKYIVKKSGRQKVAKGIYKGIMEAIK